MPFYGQDSDVSLNKTMVTSSKAILKATINGISYGSSTRNDQSRKTDSQPSLPEVVGRTVHNLSVTDTGGADFSVPIMLPSGVKNIIPSLALNYNSQNGNGEAGWGWNIAGLSTISRIGATQFHDGVIDPVDFDALDRYALDGQRLILVEGEFYGADGSVYKTENYSNIKVVASSNRFIVYYPDGSKAFYYSRSNEWKIFLFVDPHGNKINYRYKVSGTLSLIESIHYGSKSSNTEDSPNEVEFIYEEVDPRRMNYVGGNFYYFKHLLKEIKISTKGELYRNYSLSQGYTPSGYAQVNKIVESTSTTQKPPITFVYDLPTNDLIEKKHELNPQSSVFTPDDSHILSGDFNGDGKVDYAEYSKTSFSSIDLFLSKGDNLDTQTINSNLSIEARGRAADVVLTNYQDPERRVYAKNAITIVEEEIKDKTSEQKRFSEVRFKSYAINGDGQTIVSYSKKWENSNIRNHLACHESYHNARINKKQLSGDFNGDGIIDILLINFPYQNYTDCETSESEAFKTESPNGCDCSLDHINQSKVFFADMRRDLITDFVDYTGSLSVPIGVADQLYASDFDGDGKSDLYHLKERHIYVYTFDKDNRLQLRVVQEIDSYDPNTPALLGDFNGDGKTDLLNPLGFESVNWWKLYYADGNGFSTRRIIRSDLTYQKDYIKNNTSSIWGGIKVFFDRSAKAVEGSLYSYIPQDINGDGTTDIIKHERQIDIKRRYGEDKIKVINKVSVYQNRFDSTGNSTFDFQASFSTDKILPIDSSYGTIFRVSRDSYNSGLTYSFITGETIYEYKFESNHQEEVLLQSISHKGVQQQLNYKGLTTDETEAIYEQDYSQVYPFVNINNASIALVDQVATSVDGQTTIEQFRYRGAISHLGGLGFQGFKAFGRTNAFGRTVKKIWNVTERDPQKRGAVVKRWNSIHPLLEEPNNIINKVDYNYHTQLSDKGVFINKLDAVHIQNALTGVESMRTFTYDAYHNPSRAYTEYFSSGTLDASMEENITYQNNPAGTGHDYYVGRLDKEVVTHTRGTESLSRTTDYITYSKNLPTVLEISGTDTDIITERRTYDAFGNRTQSVFTAPRLSQQESFEFSTDGRFMTKETNRKGIATHYTHTPAGRIETITSPLGRTTTLEYDAFQRLKSSTDYLDQMITTQYSWDNNKLVETTSAAHGVSSKRIWDPNGRLAHQGKQLMNNWQWTSNTYDEGGNLKTRSEPYVGANPTLGGLKTYFGYDGYGRQTTASMPSGRTFSSSYALGKNQTTLKDAYQTLTSKHDAQGNIVERSEPGGVLTFQYHPNGALKSSNYDGHTVSTLQDGWGRKKGLTDPSTGSLSFEINAFGQLEQEESLWGTTTYGYTPEGLLDWKKQKGDATDLETTYAYVSGTELLSKEVTTDHLNGDVYSLAYTYDKHNRIEQATETNAFVSFVQDFTYDSFGRVHTDSRTIALVGEDTQTSVLTYGYAENGTLKNIKNGTKTLWEVTRESNRGEVTGASLGNGIKASKTIDALGFVDQINEGNALKLALNYNKKKGVLNSRTQGTEQTEHFRHDSQNRLTERLRDTLQEQFEYDNYSRFKENPAVGEYHYDNPDNRYVLDSMYLNGTGLKYFTEHPKQTVDYNIDRKAVRVVEEGNGTADFIYNGNRERVHAFYGNEEEALANRTYRKHYSSLFPAEVTLHQPSGQTNTVLYVGGDAYTAPVALINSEDHYLHRDHLGSILGITDSSGTLVEERTFSPWGELDRFVLNGIPSTDFSTSLLPRGFTGHEHFSKVALIHMNGRLYDPQLKRFLSPDNNLLDPFDSRSYDRYGYVLNNPLINTDPSKGNSPQRSWQQ